MSKIAEYLQEHLTGEVTADPEVRRHFAHDASVLRLVPSMVVYPRDETDVRKTARFVWQLAERGSKLPITARGGGSDTSGAAIGSGIALVFPAHMNRLLALDPKKQSVTVEPGITYDKLEQTLYTHGLFLPPCPSSSAYATIGGGLANNAIGDRTLKYGDTKKYVQSLRVVLANGEVIETGPMNKRALSHKMGLSSLEGQIYRAVDTLTEENAQLIDDYRGKFRTPHNAIGYNLWDIKSKDGFDLTPLIVGSQGTLGIITEATFKLQPHVPITKLALVSLPTLRELGEILPGILALKPSICDMINKAALDEVAKLNAKQLGNVLEFRKAEIHLLIEFDDKPAQQQKYLKALSALAEGADGYCMAAATAEDQQQLRKIREAVATLMNSHRGPARAVPVAEDIAVPTDSLVEFLEQVYKTCAATHIAPAIWGQAGSGVVRLHPMLDLGEVGDRQKFFKISSELYAAAARLGGSITAAAGDGRVRAPYARSLQGEPYHQLILRVKHAFDPHSLLNPGAKTATTQDVKNLLRSDYSFGRHEHLPRS